MASLFFLSTKRHEIRRQNLTICRICSQLVAYSSQLIFNFQLCIMNYELNYGVPAPLRSAVGLSAISFSASLQKDAAPIPNAGRIFEP